MCNPATLAITISSNTIDLITNSGYPVPPKEDLTKIFLISCPGSSHESARTMSKSDVEKMYNTEISPALNWQFLNLYV